MNGYGDDVIDHFRKKSLFCWDTSDHQEHDAKNRLSIPIPSPEKLLAEIDRLKKNRPHDFLMDEFSIKTVSEISQKFANKG